MYRSFTSLLIVWIYEFANDDVESYKNFSNPSKFTLMSFCFLTILSLSLTTDNEPVELPLPLSILSKLAEYISNKDTL